METISMTCQFAEESTEDGQIINPKKSMLFGINLEELGDQDSKKKAQDKQPIQLGDFQY
jgi:hypothetical protein